MNENQNTSDNFNLFENLDLDFSSIDSESIDIIMKALGALSSLKNEDDSRSILLHAIKPHLTNKRAEEIDMCVKLLKLTAILDVFKNNK